MSVDKRTRTILRRLLDNGEYYAAHQKYRTTAARLLKSAAPSNFSSHPSAASELPYDDAAVDAANLLFEGAKELMAKGETGSACDLAVYLIDTWRSRNVVCSDTERSQVQQLIALAGSGGSWRKTIIDNAFNWTSKTGQSPAGDLPLHAYVGEVLYKAKDYANAESHLLASPNRDSAKLLAQMHFSWAESDSQPMPASAGRYATRATLSYLETKSILAVRTYLAEFFSLLLAKHSDILIETIPYPYPASASRTSEEIHVTTIASLNFAQLAVRTCQVGVGEAKSPTPQNSGKGVGKASWQALIGKYEREVPWLKSPSVKEATQAIGTIYFGIKPAGGNNMLGDLMAGLFGGGAPAAGGAKKPASGRITPAGLD